ncbi:hypothetical protein A2U01_0022693, partial [Trifolium medium]|nr:hypothetical protein [Trifolium medium]
RELVFSGNFLGRVGVFSDSLETEGCLSDLCVESSGQINFDLRSGVGLCPQVWVRVCFGVSFGGPGVKRWWNLNERPS